MFAIQVGSGPSSRALALHLSTVVIGRAAECDVSIPGDLSISRRHAALIGTDLGWVVKDLDSRNGTFVNGLRVKTRSRLKPGDRVLLGSSTGFELVELGPSWSAPTAMTPQATQPVALSAREQEVLRLLCLGLSDAEIAERLTVGVRTVHTHLTRIRDKSGRRRRVELASLGAELGLR